MAEPVIVTPEDVQNLNRTALQRSTAFVRIAGTALVVIGVLGVAAWAWTTVRTQQRVSDGLASGFGTSGGDIDLVDRVDLIAPAMSTLVLAGLAVGFGLMLRLVADFTLDRVGGTLTGFEPGDTLDDDDDAGEDDPAMWAQLPPPPS